MKKKEIRKNYNEGLISPDNIKGFQGVVNYFLYHSPNLDCIHCKKRLYIDQQEEILKEMIEKAGINKKEYRFIKRKSKIAFEKLDLQKDTIEINSNRFICIKYYDKNTKEYETDFESLMRHLRNCFAHGNIASFKQDRIILKDCYNGDNNAVLVLSKNILRDWKAILENIII